MEVEHIGLEETALCWWSDMIGFASLKVPLEISVENDRPRASIEAEMHIRRLLQEFS